MKLHVVDGTYELFRAYFAVPSRRAPDGREVAAVRGVVESLLGLLRRPGVTHVAVATDHVIRSFRNELYPGYKTEAGVPEDLLAQFDLVERAIETIGIAVWPMVEHEADDALATGAARFAGEVEQVVVATPDKDLAQCVVERHVVLWDRRRDIVLDAEGVLAKYGVPPSAIPDWLALVGDAADGYPGIPGWGAKTAAALLRRWGRLEDIPRDPARWDAPSVRGAPRLAAVLVERFEEALLYRRLATLRTDSPIHERLEDLRWRGVRSDALGALCRELGWSDFHERPLPEPAP
jgi:5'-3' exonuclease